MGTIGSFARLTPLEVERATVEPGWLDLRLEELEREAYETVPAPPPAESRSVSLYKESYQLQYLLMRADFPVEIIGVRRSRKKDPSAVRGLWLPPDVVRVAAEALAATSFDELARGLGADELEAIGIPPEVWDEFLREATRTAFEALPSFFAAASQEGDTVVYFTT